MPVINYLIRFIICTMLVFGISYGLLQIILACEGGKINSDLLSSVSTGIFMVFNFPIWIICRGDNIFHFDNNIVMMVLLLDSAFYGLVLASWFTNLVRRRKTVVERKSLE